jgi:acylaminoacyl-peptidase
LASPVGGAHHSTATLLSYDLETEQTKVIVPIISQPTDFPGLYPDALPRNCFLSTDQGLFIVCSTPWRSQKRVIAIHFESGKVIPLSMDHLPATVSMNVLDVVDNTILVMASHCDFPWKVYSGTLKEDSLAFEWSLVYAPLLDPMVSEKLSQQTIDIVQLSGSPVVEGILWYPKQPTPKTPLVVLPHGGPHGVLTTDFSHFSGFLTEGMALLMVNYTGSIGFGEDSIQSLLGHIGTLDVQNVHELTLQVLEKYSFLDHEKVALFGGSHGGFLTAHLLGKYPLFYKW